MAVHGGCAVGELILGLFLMVFVSTITSMRITFDPAKRDKTWVERGLDFADAEIGFAGVTLEVEDIRKAYGEA